MFNQLKKNGIVTDFIKKTIPKKGSKFLLKKVLGIFMLSSVRTFL